MEYDSIKKFGYINNVQVIDKPKPIFPRLDIDVEVDYIRSQMLNNTKTVSKPDVQKLVLMILRN